MVNQDELKNKLFKHNLANIESSKIVNSIFKELANNEYLFDEQNKYYSILEVIYLENINAKSQFLIELERFVNSLNGNDVDSIFYTEKLMEYKNMIVTIINNIKSVPLLQSLITENIGTCVIGANGVGKTTMISDLKKNKLSNLIVIPADKPLHHKKSSSAFNPDELDTIKLLQNLNLKHSDKPIHSYFGNNNEYFISNMMTNIIDQHVKCLDEGDINNSIFIKIEKIWNKLYPEIKIKKRIQYRDFSFSKNESGEYFFNSLSDGERVSLLYLFITLSVENPSIFVVDEPESHLNIALCNDLWSEILKIKSDCKFIFISHQNQFIASHANLDLIWCKNYESTEVFDVKRIDNNHILPKELMVNLLGTQKTTIFCEGEYTSLDYKLYSAVLGEKFSIKPVGGHSNVINYTIAFNDLNYGNAIGIIDRDEREENDIEILKKKNVYVLPCNEVEMIFLHKELEQYTGLNEEYYDLFYKKLNTEKEKIILKYIKKKIKLYFENNSVIEEYDFQKFKKEYDNWKSEINVDELYEYYNNKIEEIVSQKDYCEFLKICSIKKANKLDLNNNFYEEQLSKLIIDDEYKSDIRKIIDIDI